MKRLMILALPVAAIVALLLFRPKHDTRVANPVDAGPAVTVAIFRPTAGTRGSSLVLPGRLKAQREISLSSPLASRLTGLPLREGEAFRAGEPLALFDSPEARQNMESARAAVQAALADLGQARTQSDRIDSLA
ncbi:MAG TPA: hypothetical protein VF720_13425, partial [Candidatus Eisenbacteria bacterium]